MQGQLRHVNWRTVVTAGLLAVLGGLVAAVICLAAVPPVTRDALTHHLYVPKLYLEYGDMREIPWVVFSYFPMNLDLLYMIPLAFGNDIAPKYIHFAFAIVTAFIIHRWLRRWENSLTGLFGALLFLSTPIILKLSISVYVDLGLICFTTMALYALVRWMEAGLRLRYLLTAAFACGLALGTKYNGLLVLCISGALVPLACAWGTRNKPVYQVRALGMGVLYVVIALVIFSPWLVRNAIWTGNPTYPLYDDLFIAHNNERSETKADRIREQYEPKLSLNHFSIRELVFKESKLQVALIPLRIFFQGQDGNPRLFDGRLNCLLFFLPFLSFLNIQNLKPYIRKGQIILALFSVIYILMVYFSTDMRIRYMAPAIPPLVILSAMGMARILGILSGLKHNWLKASLTSMLYMIVTGALFFNLAYLAGLFTTYKPMAYIQNNISREAYIEAFWPEYRVLQFTNQSLPNEAKILGIFLGNRGYYSDRSIRFSTTLLNQLIQSSANPAEAHAMLVKDGFSHIIINTALYENWVLSELGAGEKDKTIAFFNEFAHPLFKHAEITLYGLKAPQPEKS